MLPLLILVLDSNIQNQLDDHAYYTVFTYHYSIFTVFMSKILILGYLCVGTITDTAHPLYQFQVHAMQTGNFTVLQAAAKVFALFVAAWRDAGSLADAAAGAAVFEAVRKQCHPLFADTAAPPWGRRSGTRPASRPAGITPFPPRPIKYCPPPARTRSETALPPATYSR